jgi:hypothetical protein
MTLFDADIGAQRKAQIEATIAARMKQRRAHGQDPAAGGDPVADEQRLIGDLLDYGRNEYEAITYDLYNARRFVRMFPDEAEGGGGPFGSMKRLYQRVVRRLLRQQIVFNEAVLGVLEDLEARVKKLEEKQRMEKD